jgi:hypothetical protein
MGYSCEQICLSYKRISPDTEKKTRTCRIKNPARLALGILRKIKGRAAKKRFERIDKKYSLISLRRAAFDSFSNTLIPHSDKVYHPDTLSDSLSVYDTFITGSDQVWSLRWMANEFLLRFVPSDKKKIAYAASIGRASLTDSQRDLFKNSLSSFSAVSVREKKSVELLSGTGVDVECVLDPTLLLSKDDWDAVCEEYPLPSGTKYLFCYFLGKNEKNYRIAKKFAARHGLKLVNIPYAGGRLRVDDGRFGDIRVFNASPQQFLWLIKNAEYVFTDSFHAVIFSNVYHKQFFAFDRNKNGEMRSRMTDITELFNESERFRQIEKKTDVRTLEEIGKIDYSSESANFVRLKEISINFLRSALES